MIDNIDEVAEKRVAVLRNIEKEKLRAGAGPEFGVRVFKIIITFYCMN
jgi:hypothetical protein